MITSDSGEVQTLTDHFIRAVFGILGICLCWAIFVSDSGSQQAANNGPSLRSTSSPETGSDGKAIPDVSVIDQNGRPRRFYSDLVKQKVVAINFVYTTCTMICPPLGATFGKLQKSLGEHFGKDVFLISISVDPAADSPDRLRSWAAQFGAQPGWTLVTGHKMEINRLLKALGSDTASPESHSPMVLIINDKRAAWKRVYGLGATAALSRSIEQMLALSSASASEKNK